MEKSKIRIQNKQRRSQMSRAEASFKSTAIAKLILGSEFYKNANTIMLYMPLGNEVDTGTIMKNALQDGKRVVLPVTDNADKILPCYADEATQYCTGRFSVREPKDANPADLKAIDLVIVPGIAFDRAGNRIGFGKGCYDGFLKTLKAVKIGVCYDFQVCDEIETDQFDEKMDYVATNSGWL